ncbi:MAG TPA: glycosyltransferase family 2 protein [Bacilli bacterium]|nr:glycosyltransferase family 2 protein [Bacilli bacterium]
MNNILIIIPSLEPNRKMIDFVKEIYNSGFKKIAIVDDGSSKKYQDIFEEMEQYSTIYHHDINLGKGEAIKTAIRNYDSKDIDAYLTCDSDGQHTVEDIIRVSKCFIENKDNIVLGIRNFNQDNIPSRSKFGNKMSSIFFKLRTGITLPDTQTGLRVFSIKYKKFALSVEGSRFEYEMNFLLKAADLKYKFKYLDIKTIYEDNNSGSHFHILRDSYLIYEEPFKYLITSIIISFLNSIFSDVQILNIIMFLISLFIGFNMNREWVFKSKGNKENEIIKYIVLNILIIIINILLSIKIFFLNFIIGIIMFILLYVIERKYIFNNK